MVMMSICNHLGPWTSDIDLTYFDLPWLSKDNNCGYGESGSATCVWHHIEGCGWMGWTYMTLSDCPAWIHKAELCKIFGIKSGAVYGQYHALTCVISIIKNGKGGNWKKGTAVTINPSFCCDLTITGDWNRVVFQLCEKEMFGTGSLRNISVQQPDRWFCIGPNPALAKNLQKILAEAVGDA
jgi:hypothetical protein